MPLSTKQMEYLALAWQCFDAEPKIDYEKFKEVAGLASAASAREIMRMTKKKLKEEYGALSGALKIANGGTGGGGGMDSPVKMKKKMVCTPTSGTKRSRPSTPASALASATKKTKARKTNAGDSDEDEHEHEHENDDEALTPVAKRIKTLVSSNKKKNKEVEEVKPEPVVSDDDDGFLV